MNYFLPDDYEPRLGAPQDPIHESQIRDDWQDEVYRHALAIADYNNLNRVLDIGCGSGFKLMKYFSDRITMGVDIPVTVARLRRVYPKRVWVSDWYPPEIGCPKFDLVICADVIEHVDDPDNLISMIKSTCPKYVVISTPDRDLTWLWGKKSPTIGPPLNPCHVREWSMSEFRSYIEWHWPDKAIAHGYSNKEQATQYCVINADQRRD